jgi:type II secretory ATPase GspE/PulE/Tfp pilus assembly ATPase PilB-like protein
MGVESYLLAQRLVRTICPACRGPHVPDEEALKRAGHSRNGRTGHFFRGAGCRQCRQTGYLGRTGIFELLRVTPNVREAIVRRDTTGQIAAAAPPDHQPMREDGYWKAAAGVTTLEEVLQVTQDTQTEEALS